MIKVIAFDYADVIAPSHVGKWTKKNLTPENNNYHYYKKNEHKWDTGQMNLNQLYDVLSHVTGTPNHLIWNTFYKNLEADKDIIKIIEKLKGSYKIFLFSNHLGELLRQLLKKQGVVNLFDEIIISSEHKLKKPDPEFFEVLINKAKVKNNEILFIDDRLENIEGALNLGINAFHFTTSKKLKKHLRSLNLL